MTVTANGKIYIIEDGISLKRFLETRGFDPAKTVVAVNGSIAGGDCSVVILKENDVLDIMTFVGGG